MGKWRIKGKHIIILLIAYLIYSLTSVFTKCASMYDVLSLQYILFVLGAVCVMGLYALIWQQIIKRMPISEAYMFKGTSIVFILLLSTLLFGEDITLQNIIGSVIIILGIALFAKSDKEVSK